MPHRILLIDDEEDLVEMLSFRLRALGFEMLSAATGQSGLKIARDESPDLILLDIMMPDVNGQEVCRKLKDDVKTSNIPVIFFTAFSKAALGSVVKDAGAVDYISKPFEPEQLLGKIYSILGRSDAEKK